jgi:hypothetical protein
LAKKKGEQYECEECGLVVLVENPCECGEECQIICCEEPMKVKAKAPEKASEKPKK